MTGGWFNRLVREGGWGGECKNLGWKVLCKEGSGGFRVRWEGVGGGRGRGSGGNEEIGLNWFVGGVGGGGEGGGDVGEKGFWWYGVLRVRWVNLKGVVKFGVRMCWMKV